MYNISKGSIPNRFLTYAPTSGFLICIDLKVATFIYEHREEIIIVEEISSCIENTKVAY